MRWRTLSDYAAISDCGQYRINRTVHATKNQYTVWHQQQVIGITDDRREAMDCAARHKARHDRAA